MGFNSGLKGLRNTIINNRVVHNILFGVIEPFVVEFYDRSTAFRLTFVNPIKCSYNKTNEIH
jgi:hypothetical protein